MERTATKRRSRGYVRQSLKVPGFTLFEVILAIALSTMLLALIGAAINLFLRNIEAQRRDVEMAQLARAIFTMIGDDLRAASEYRPQNLDGVIALAASSATDINSVTDGAATGTGGTGTDGTGTSGTGAGGTSTGSTSTGGTTSSSTSTTSTTTEETIPPGIQGDLTEIWIDTSRPPRPEQLFDRYTGYSGIQQVMPVGQIGPGGTAVNRGAMTPATDLKLVRYFVRLGQAVDVTSADATSLSPNMQYLGAGLVRQELDRAERAYADQVGDTSFYELNQQLVAPEVGRIEFRYFDGSAVLGNWDSALQEWDMSTNGQLPTAVEVRLYLGDPTEMVNIQAALTMGSALSESTREFRQVFFLPTFRPAEETETDDTTMQ